MVFHFKNGSISVTRRVFDFTNQSNAKSVGTPDIKGTDKNKLSKSWTVFTQENSELPWDMTRAVGNDLDNSIWIGTDNGIVKISNGKWTHFNSKNTTAWTIKLNLYREIHQNLPGSHKQMQSWCLMAFGCLVL